MELILIFLKREWKSVVVLLMIAALSVTILYKNHRIEGLELDLAHKQLVIDKARADYDRQSKWIASLNAINRAEVAGMRETYRETLIKERKSHAQTYKIAIANADAAGRMRLATGNAGDCTLPADDAAAARTDGGAEGGQAAETVSVGDCIDAAIQIEGLHKYIRSELSHINQPAKPE